MNIYTHKCLFINNVLINKMYKIIKKFHARDKTIAQQKNNKILKN